MNPSRFTCVFHADHLDDDLDHDDDDGVDVINHHHHQNVSIHTHTLCLSHFHQLHGFAHICIFRVHFSSIIHHIVT